MVRSPYTAYSIYLRGTIDHPPLKQKQLRVKSLGFRVQGLTCGSFPELEYYGSPYWVSAIMQALAEVPSILGRVSRA